MVAMAGSSGRETRFKEFAVSSYRDWAERLRMNAAKAVWSTATPPAPAGRGKKTTHLSLAGITGETVHNLNGCSVGGGIAGFPSDNRLGLVHAASREARHRGDNSQAWLPLDGLTMPDVQRFVNHFVTADEMVPSGLAARWARSHR